MCAGCHEDIAKAFDKSTHHRITLKKQWTETACESCHGPGAKHAESAEAKDIRNLAKLSPSEVDKTCLTCHKNQPTQTGRIRSGHFRNEVACTSCHTVHQEPAKLVSRNASEDQRKMRVLPYRRMAGVPASARTPPAARGDELRGLPQPARGFPAELDADGERQ